MATMAKVDEIHANSKIEEVPLAKLQVDYTYQRDTSERLVDDIANNWDVVASELILVSDRGTRPKEGDIRGGLFVVNGQHRSKAAQKRGMEKIWARVIDLRKVQDPAELEAGFRLKTNVRLGDRPLERFKAQVRAKDAESLAIQKILAAFGTEINTQVQAEVGINAVATVEAIYRADDGALLRETLEVIRDVWRQPGGKNSTAAIMKGIAWFVEKHSEESDRRRLVDRLKSAGLAQMEQRARTIGLSMGGSLWMNYYRAIVDLYNENLREKNKLSWMMRGAGRLESTGGAARSRAT